MVIEKDKRVTLDYKVKFADTEEVIDQSEGRGPMQYVHQQGQIIPGLEKALDGVEEGSEINIIIEPSDAYGDRLDENVVKVPKKNLPEDIPREQGTEIEMQQGEQTFRGLITEVDPQDVTVDFNHPLAGKRLDFWVKVQKVENA